jgi:hypothetical protein
MRDWCLTHIPEFSDGLPVTLRFADLVGEILTAGPTDTKAPLPFKFYI